MKCQGKKVAEELERMRNRDDQEKKAKSNWASKLSEARKYKKSMIINNARLGGFANGSCIATTPNLPAAGLPVHISNDNVQGVRYASV
ncbi:uncharacterized protein G2W53_031602 [Senna tora]|uniref:Uncharacterized protein n=1 Tax=Senna tora TaxID=362788 RepID=A0A834T916_9FABA|nr:uncharacterized protein G2W53_031602 [Senna tora]